MLKITTIATLCALSLTCQCHAFKVISEKRTTSPGFVGGIIHVESLLTSSAMSVQAQSFAFNTIGHPNEYLTIQGTHRIGIRNSDNISRRFTYTYILKCESVYQNIEKTIELNPDETFHDDARSYGVAQKKDIGRYPIDVHTNIIGLNNANSEAHAALIIQK